MLQFLQSDLDKKAETFIKCTKTAKSTRAKNTDSLSASVHYAL